MALTTVCRVKSVMSYLTMYTDNMGFDVISVKLGFMHQVARGTLIEIELVKTSRVDDSVVESEVLLQSNLGDGEVFIDTSFCAETSQACS